MAQLSNSALDALEQNFVFSSKTECHYHLGYSTVSRALETPCSNQVLAA